MTEESKELALQKAVELLQGVIEQSSSEQRPGKEQNQLLKKHIFMQEWLAITSLFHHTS